MDRDRIDWSQFWCPGPTRVFSDDELARAGAERPGRTFVAMVLANLAVAGFAVLQLAPPGGERLLAALMVGGLLLALPMAVRLWRRPTRKALQTLTLAYAAAAIWAGGLLGLSDWRPPQPTRGWAVTLCWAVAMMVALALWFITVYRSEQIASRLREEDERALAAERARRLAAAQMQPHFLFNSLAALQHWVQTKDDRAAPMLAALSGFLRATLPLFDRPRLRLGDELDAVRQYLDVMALRFGDRLTYGIDATAQAAETELPPALLLALVENAVEHGVTPSVRGATITVSARLVGERLQLEVRDSGPGPQPGATDGVGLANGRARLALAYGDAASLQISAAAEGGCVARIELPTRHR